MTKARKVRPSGRSTDTDTDELEGEGSYTAARRYDESLRRFVTHYPVETLAEAASRALDGPEADALRAAEQVGKTGRPERPTKRQKR